MIVPCFQVDLAVQFDDVDMYGVVHHARYVLYMERARIDLFVRIGHPPSPEVGTDGVLMVTGLEVSYLWPSRLLDTLRVETHCQRVRGSMIMLASRILAGDEVRAEGVVKLAFVGVDGKLQRVPAGLKAALLDPATPHADGSKALDAA